MYFENTCRAIGSVIRTVILTVEPLLNSIKTVQHKALLLERQACTLSCIEFFLAILISFLFFPSSRGDWWPWLQSTMWYMEYRCNNVYSVSFQSFVHYHDSICVFIYMCVSQEKKNWYLTISQCWRPAPFFHKYQKFNQFTNICCFLLWDVIEGVCGIRPQVTFCVRSNSPLVSQVNTRQFQRRI